MVERLELVVWSYGVIAVSGVAIVTRASGTASTSAAICASIVRAPWPISTVLASTVTLPSACSRTMASDTLGAIDAFSIAATPRARSAASGALHWIASAARPRLSSSLPSIGVSPGANSSPWASKFCRRRSTGSRPSASAATSISDSSAHASCGTPKPRNAPPGVVFV